MRRRRPLIVVGTLLALLGALIPSLTGAVAPSRPPAVDLPPGLLSKAQAMGKVRVIASLRVPFLPEGQQAGTAIRAQRSRINAAQDALLASLTTGSVRENRRFASIPALALSVDASALQALAASPLVASIEEDVAVPPSLPISTEMIGASTAGTGAWAQGFTGSGWAVAILDTGTQTTHPFFSGKTVAEACYSTNDASGQAASFCPGGVSSSTAAGSAAPCPASIVGCSHGTHVAGIAVGGPGIQGATGPNPGATFYGVARDARLIAIQVFSRVDDPAACGSLGPPCPLSFTSDQLMGLERVLALHTAGIPVAAANMSLGGGNFTAHCDAQQPSRKAAIDNLRSYGIATVISSGNEGYTGAMGAPACISTAVSVASTSRSAPVDQVSGFSNVTSFLDLFAPGEPIYSSVPTNAYEAQSGTSMAAPHVAGAWAIMKQKAPSLSVDLIQAAFEATGVLVTDTRPGAPGTVSKKRIDVGQALSQLDVIRYTRAPVVFQMKGGGW